MFSPEVIANAAVNETLHLQTRRHPPKAEHYLLGCGSFRASLIAQIKLEMDFATVLTGKKTAAFVQNICDYWLSEATEEIM